MTVDTFLINMRILMNRTDITNKEKFVIFRDSLNAMTDEAATINMNNPEHIIRTREREREMENLSLEELSVNQIRLEKIMKSNTVRMFKEFKKLMALEHEQESHDLMVTEV